MMNVVETGLGTDKERLPNGSEFWALKDISLTVNQGEVVGIIGRNGAGKSTLLKILSRITEPTSGEAFIDGRVGSLLEVGTGFHPELTGRENIYLNGAILGMKRSEITSKFDDIVEFAEIDKFIDTPVKRYSSGMYVRLAFAVAAHLESEILLVDEVLAVGDAAFQRKCLGKMGEVATEGRTILFVSHNMGAINQLCKRCILLDRGHLIKDDTTDTVISSYAKESVHYDEKADRKWERKGSGKVRILSISLLDENNHACNTYRMGQVMKIKLLGDAIEPDIDFTLAIQIVTLTDIPVLYLNNPLNIFRTSLKKDFRIEINIPDLPLMPGSYFLHIWVGRVRRELFDYVKYIASFDILQGKKVRLPLRTNYQLGLVYLELSATQLK
ncbi:MAG: ABC transporter ATP-binding protein [Desulfobacterales bacterium]|nr:ABC transporter ATP-binding protein [Desulfobacterales bacterium]